MTALVTQVNSAIVTALAADQTAAIAAAVTTGLTSALSTAVTEEIVRTLTGGTSKNAPAFVRRANIGYGVVTAAVTAKDGSGALVTCFTAGVNGSRLDQLIFISAQATRAASSAMTGTIFLTDTAGANPQLFSEIVLPTLTPSTTVAGQIQTISFYNGLKLSAGQLVQAAISVYAGAQDRYVVWGIGGDY